MAKAQSVDMKQSTAILAGAPSKPNSTSWIGRAVLGGVLIATAAFPKRVVGAVGYVFENVGKLAFKSAEGLSGRMVSSVPEGRLGLAIRSVLGLLGVAVIFNQFVPRESEAAKLAKAIAVEINKSELKEIKVQHEGSELTLCFSNVKLHENGLVVAYKLTKNGEEPQDLGFDHHWVLNQEKAQAHEPSDAKYKETLGMDKIPPKVLEAYVQRMEGFMRHLLNKLPAEKLQVEEA